MIRKVPIPGQPSYSGSTRNGVTSHNYQGWPESYRLEKVSVPTPTDSLRPSAPLAPPTGPMASGSQVRQVTGSTTGNVWGADVYTSDSDLGTAAVHAGLLKEGETKTLRITMLPGRNSYSAMNRNGVQSRSWLNWSASYWLESVDESQPLPAIDERR
jgi:hypothetical protein